MSGTCLRHTACYQKQYNGVVNSYGWVEIWDMKYFGEIRVGYQKCYMHVNTMEQLHNRGGGHENVSRVRECAAKPLFPFEGHFCENKLSSQNISTAPPTRLAVIGKNSLALKVSPIEL